MTKHPTILLVQPQLAENIGMVARAMANFGLSELRLRNSGLGLITLEVS